VLESGGARVVPIPHKASHALLTELFHSINGILFTGGSLSLEKNTIYYQTAKFFYDLAISSARKGDYFPIWGTCQGFQLLSIITANNETVDERYEFDSENLPLFLNFQSGARNSRMFRDASEEIYDAFRTQPITMNLHHDGVPPIFFQTNSNLKSFYQLISTNADRKGKPFGSSFEGKVFPVYGVQFHPERNAFEWDVQEHLDHAEIAVKAMQHLSRFYVGECRKSTHKFASAKTEYDSLIYNWTPSRTANSSDPYPDQQTYFFTNLHDHMASLFL